ncbi:MAG: hypothetical protein ACYC9W_07730 [Candidatus Limnocylindria bacterium]
MKKVERALIATGAALVLSGGIASATILWTSATAAAAQPRIGTQLAARLGGSSGALADHGPNGAPLISAAAAYIGISAADLGTQLASGKSLSDVAVANGKTRDGLIAALVAAEQRSISTFVDQKKGGPGMGWPGMFGKGGRGERGLIGDSEQAAATYLGATVADLETKTDAGQALAAIANATSGKSRDGLIQALVADATAKIERAKTNGTITATRATALEAGLTARITAQVDRIESPGH